MAERTKVPQTSEAKEEVIEGEKSHDPQLAKNSSWDHPGEHKVTVDPIHTHDSLVHKPCVLFHSTTSTSITVTRNCEGRCRE